MSGAVGAIEAVAKAIAEGFRLIAQELAKSELKKRQKAVEYGERFIRHYEDITPKESRNKTLDKYAKIFFKYNN